MLENLEATRTTVISPRADRSTSLKLKVWEALSRDEKERWDTTRYEVGDTEEDPRLEMFEDSCDETGLATKTLGTRRECRYLDLGLGCCIVHSPDVSSNNRESQRKVYRVKPHTARLR